MEKKIASLHKWTEEDAKNIINNYTRWEWIYAVAGAICILISFQNIENIFFVFWVIFGASFLTWSCIAKFQKAAFKQRYRLMLRMEEQLSNRGTVPFLKSATLQKYRVSPK